MFAEDKDVVKLKPLDTLSPPLLDDSIEEFRRDWTHVIEEFVEVVFERYELKVKENTQFAAAMAEAKRINMSQGIQKIRDFDLFKKQTFNEILATDDPAVRNSLIDTMKEKNLVLRDELVSF